VAKGANMPRIRRLIPTNLPMHIMSRGNNKQVVFNNDSDKLRYYSLLSDFKGENYVDILHYCIMVNHVHLLVMPNERTTLGRFMKQVNLSYFCYFREMNDFCGHLWQGRFKSNIIDSESYLLQCGKYIELNPVRAGIVQHPQDYRFSSYNHYAVGTNDKLITANPAYLGLSESIYKRRNKYVEFAINEEMSGLLKQKFIGSQDFVQNLEETYDTNSAPRKSGRPIKNAGRFWFSQN